MADERQAVASLGLVHEVGGERDGHVLCLTQLLQLLGQVASCGGIEAGGRLIHEQQPGFVQQRLGQFHTSAHAAGESLGVFVRAVSKVESFEPVVDALVQIASAQAVEASLVYEVFTRGEFAVEAGLLKDDAEHATHEACVAHEVMVEHAHACVVSM